MRKTCAQVETHEDNYHVKMILVINMECPRCKNTDNAYFFKTGNDVYCRKCIQFSRVNINESMKITHLYYPPLNTNYALNFELSSKQKEIAFVK